MSESVSSFPRTAGPATETRAHRPPVASASIEMSRAPIGTSSAGEVATSTVTARSPSTTPDRAWPRIVGFYVFIGMGALAGMTAESWSSWMDWAGQPWTSEACRWSVVALVGTTALSFLNTRPIFVVLAAALFAMTAYSSNLLLANKLAKWTLPFVGNAAASTVLAVAAAVFGYLVHSSSKPKAPSVRGVLSVAIVSLAGIGAVRGWFTWSDVATRLGPGAVNVVTEWGQEVVWATVLILTAIGVSWSRTRPVHLLNAVLLVSLAYACVKGGYSREVQFPELSQGGTLISIEHDSYTNVASWRWVIAAELVCLSAVLIHMAAGIGALTGLFAIVWMTVGLGLYQSIGTMALVQGGSNVIGGAMSPLAGMGLPIAAPSVPPRTNAATINRSTVGNEPVAIGADRSSENIELRRAKMQAMDASMKNARLSEQQRMAQLFRDAGPSLIGDLTIYGWMLLTSLFAGVIAVCGLRMLSENSGYRYLCTATLWVGFMGGAIALAMVWPKEPGQTWDKWLAAFRYGRHHEYVFWLTFVGAMAFFGIWALATSRRPAAWTNVAVMSILLGTLTSMSAAAILIRFGGFPPLPVWVYAVAAASQSSLMWVLLFRVNPLGPPRHATAD